MFKTDQKSLEELSFAFNEADIANLSRLLTVLRDAFTELGINVVVLEQLI